MDITNVIINISISVTAGAVAGFGVFKWLGKSWVGNWFAKDLKMYEQKLDLIKMQKSLQYSNVYIERATVIRNLYRMLGQIVIAQKYTNDTKFESVKEKKDAYLKYGELLRQFYECLMLEGIYLPNSTSDKLSYFGEAISKEIAIKQYNIGDISDEVIAAINKIPDYDLQAIFKALKDDFQELLGVKEI